MDPPTPAPIQLKTKIEVNHLQGLIFPRTCQALTMGTALLLHFRGAFLLQGKEEMRQRRNRNKQEKQQKLSLPPLQLPEL